eukprot:SAG11_NODE_7277_length_1167_cov_1.179775_2_plen_52_part_01
MLVRFALVTFGLLLLQLSLLLLSCGILWKCHPIPIEGATGNLKPSVCISVGH